MAWRYLALVVALTILAAWDPGVAAAGPTIPPPP